MKSTKCCYYYDCDYDSLLIITVISKLTIVYASMKKQLIHLTL